MEFSGLMSKKSFLDAASHAHQEADDRTDQEYDKKNLGDAGGTDGYAAESEEGCDQGYDEEYNGIMKHGCTYVAYDLSNVAAVSVSPLVCAVGAPPGGA
jgi:hypothetical protein